jgi:DNA-binding transcriptional ArsR family regulator
MAINMKIKSCPYCFKVLSDRNRAKIIARLKKFKKANVKDITSFFKLSQPTISHHLKVLKELGILKSKKISKEVFYYLNRNYSCHECHILKLPIFKK